MSTLLTNKLTGVVSAGWAIDIKSGSYIYSPGMIIQTGYVRMDAQASFAAPITGNGTTITNLGLTITPKRSTSLLYCTWMIHGEIVENSVFLIHKDGVLVTTAGYEGYNNVVGNTRWSGVLSANYDGDTATTPSNYFLQYILPAGSTTTTTIAPAIRSADANARTLFINRTTNSAGADNNEVNVSSGMIHEIAQ